MIKALVNQSESLLSTFFPLGVIFRCCNVTDDNTPADSFTNAMIIKKEKCKESGNGAVHMNHLKTHMRALHGGFFMVGLELLTMNYFIINVFLFYFSKFCQPFLELKHNLFVVLIHPITINLMYHLSADQDPADKASI